MCESPPQFCYSWLLTTIVFKPGGAVLQVLRKLQVNVALMFWLYDTIRITFHCSYCIHMQFLGQSAMLTPIPAPQDEICLVQLRCTVEDLPFLKWFFNGSEEATYVYDIGTTFPLAIELDNPFPGISIQIINATRDPNTDDINALSLLTSSTSALQQLMGQSIQCGSNVVRSDVITINATLIGTYVRIFVGTMILFVCMLCHPGRRERDTGVRVSP